MNYSLDNIKIHVCEPEDSVYKEMWYKDVTTFSHAQCLENPLELFVGDIIEDDTGARFRILSRHFKWEKLDIDKYKPILEFTVERYMRRGKQNPFML